MSAHDEIDLKAIRSERRAVKAALKREGYDLAAYATATNGWHALRFALSCYAGVFASFWLWHSGNYWAMFFGFVLLGISQHAMLNVVHEASHFSLLRNRAHNDFLGDWLFAVPIGLTVRRYRAVHDLHHQALATEDDPSGFLVAEGVPRRVVIANLLFLLFGRAIFDLLRGLLNRKAAGGTVNANVAAADRVRLVKVLALHLPILAVLFVAGYAHLWLIWVVSSVSLVPFLDGVRTIAEHRFAEGGAHSHTRSHHNSAVLSAIFAPFFQYHWEHHLFPSIPHSRLNRFHTVLIELGFRQAKPVRWGFLGALRSGLK